MANPPASGAGWVVKTLDDYAHTGVRQQQHMHMLHMYTPRGGAKHVIEH